MQVFDFPQMISLIGRVTWELVTFPAGRKAVKCKWVSKLSTMLMAALHGARRFSQFHGLLDFTETFARTVKFATLRVIFSLVAHLGLHCEQVDVDRAYFLYANLEEDMYMNQVDGFVKCGEDGTRLVCLLKKAIYRLKQGPRN